MKISEIAERLIPLVTHNKKHMALSRLLKQIPRTYGCMMCGECCKARKVVLSQAEILAIPPAAWEHFPATENGCRFLNKGGSCGIYEHRPVMCRIWGLGDSRAEECLYTKGKVNRSEVGRLVDEHEKFYDKSNIRMTT